jgi:hypothetical protein
VKQTGKPLRISFELTRATYSKLDGTKLTFNLDTDIEYDEFCDEKVAETSACQVVNEEAPILEHTAGSAVLV